MSIEQIKELIQLLWQWRKSRNHALLFLHAHYRIFTGPDFWTANPLSLWWDIQQAIRHATPFEFDELDLTMRPDSFLGRNDPKEDANP